MQFQTEAVSEVTDGTFLLYHRTNAEKPYSDRFQDKCELL
jgi:hypothetical protein